MYRSVSTDDQSTLFGESSSRFCCIQKTIEYLSFVFSRTNARHNSHCRMIQIRWIVEAMLLISSSNCHRQHSIYNVERRRQRQQSSYSMRTIAASSMITLAILSLIGTFCHVRAQFVADKRCFCKVSGEAIDDCSCATNYSIDVFNNHHVYPLLQSLLQKDFFRYYRVSRC